MCNCKAQLTAEMSKDDDNFQNPELGSVLKPDAICDGFTKHKIKGTYSNSEADTASGNILKQQELNKMDKKGFWSIIDSSLKANDQEEQFELIKVEVIKLNEADILTFSEIMRELQGKSARWEIWGAGRIIKGYCFGKNFESFLLWIISKGQSVFDNTIKNPDSLVGVITQRDIDEGVQFERLSYIAWEAYEEKTGTKMRTDRRPYSELGDNWDYDDSNVKSNDFDADLLRNMGKKWDFYNIHKMEKRYPNLLPAFLDCYLHLEKNLLKGKKLGFVYLNGELVESHKVNII
jgi:hypothetical protein